MELNIVQADISQRLCFTTALYQWDYGQILLPTGVELPSAYEVHFAVPNTDTTMTVIGGVDGVAIPDELLTTAGQIVAYIYLHSGEDDGETEYKINIPVKSRPQPSDYEPTPVQQDVITQTIGALQNAVSHVDDVAENLQTEIVTAVQEELATGQYKGEKGDKGDKGDTGAKGDKGDTGIGIPVGGTTGQVLAKASDADYDTEWVNQSGGGGGTSDYTDLTNKPKINNVELNGNKSLADLGIVIPTVPVTSVNNKTGSVVLNASDVGAISTEVDPTVPSWAKQPSKPSYTASEVGALPSTTVIPTKTSDLTNDSGYITSAPVSSVNGQTGAVVIANATTSADGLLSATDKGRLDALYDDYSSAMTALGV